MKVIRKTVTQGVTRGGGISWTHTTARATQFGEDDIIGHDGIHGNSHFMLANMRLDHMSGIISLFI
jgi:hypothetical protein